MGSRVVPWRAFSSQAAARRSQPPRRVLQIVSQSAAAPPLATEEQVNMWAAGQAGGQPQLQDAHCHC